METDRTISQLYSKFIQLYIFNELPLANNLVVMHQNHFVIILLCVPLMKSQAGYVPYTGFHNCRYTKNKHSLINEKVNITNSNKSYTS